MIISIIGILIEIIGFIFLLDKTSGKLRSYIEQMHPAGNRPAGLRYKLVVLITNHTRKFAIYLVIFGLALQIIGIISV